MSIIFEGYDRRVNKLNKALNEYGIKDIDDAKKICDDKGVDVYSIVKGIQGKGGGYRLTRKPSEYKVGEILRLTEGNLAPVTCVECDDEEREQKGETRTIGMWEEIDKIVNDYFDSKTIEDLMYKDVAAYI